MLDYTCWHPTSYKWLNPPASNTQQIAMTHIADTVIFMIGLLDEDFGSILKKWTQIYTNCYNKTDTKGGKFHGRRKKESVR